MESTERKKIIYVFFTDKCSGAEISCMNYITKLDRTRFSPIVLVPEQGKVCELLGREHIPFIIQKTSLFSFRNPFPFFKTVVEVRKILKKENIDIVHVNSLYPNQYAVLAAKLCHIPCIVHFQNINSAREFRRYLLGLADKIIVVSKTIASPVEKYVSDAKIMFLYHAVDCHRFAPLKNKLKKKILQNEYGIKSKERCICLLGLIEERKGHPLFLQAAKKIIQKNKNVHFFIVGDALFTGEEYKNTLKNFVIENNIQNNVHFTGFREDIASLLHEFEVMVFPYANEPLGLAVIEAAAAGKAIVGFASGGIPEIIESGKNGILVPENDVQELTKAIQTYLDNPSLRKAHEAAARERMLADFNIEKNVKKLMEVYDELLKSK